MVRREHGNGLNVNEHHVRIRAQAERRQARAEGQF
jgi:hypothetical protein